MILERSAVAIGLMAAAIAVGGFLGRAVAVLGAGGPPAVERRTMVGGLIGLGYALNLVLLDTATG